MNASGHCGSRDCHEKVKYCKTWQRCHSSLSGYDSNDMRFSVVLNVNIFTRAMISTTAHVLPVLQDCVSRVYHELWMLSSKLDWNGHWVWIWPWGEGGGGWNALWPNSVWMRIFFAWASGPSLMNVEDMWHLTGVCPCSFKIPSTCSFIQSPVYDVSTINAATLRHFRLSVGRMKKHCQRHLKVCPQTYKLTPVSSLQPKVPTIQI